MFRDQIYRFRYFIYYYIKFNLKRKYQKSFLGYLWSLITPMVNFLILSIVFSKIVRFEMKDYFLYFFSGALFFNIATITLNNAPSFFESNFYLIKKVGLPKIIYVVNGVLYECFNLVITLASFFLLIVILGRCELTFQLLLLPIPVILLILFLIGLSSIISLGTIYFRDVRHLVPIVMQSLFFLTPIVYPINAIPDWMKYIVYCNPFYYYIDLFRGILLTDYVFSYYGLIACVVLSTVSFVTGISIVQKYNNKIILKL